MTDVRTKLNFEITARRLVAANIADAVRCASDIRERIEIVHTTEYANFLRHLFPSFRNVLQRSLNPSICIDEPQIKFRHLILEILNRLPNNEVLRPYAPELLRIATETLSHDTEENALTCLRIIFDLHKNFRPALESEVQSFLDLVQRIYRLLPKSIKTVFVFTKQYTGSVQHGSDPLTFSNVAIGASLFHNPISSCEKPILSVCETTSGQGIVPSCASASIGSIPVRQSGLKGLDSFRVLTECPLIVMLLFQLYPKYIQENIPLLTPLMMGGLALHTPASAYRLQRDRYKEFIACQVKTLSFLTYLLRGFSELMKPFEDAISIAVIGLMIACPGDAIATRKELLVATRHILATEFRRGFYRHVDTLLNENVLIGAGHPNRATLRPLAFSTLADLVHHVRAELNLSQLSRVVLLFSRNLHDPALPLNVQTTSVRLLLNLVDFIFHSSEAEGGQGKQLLIHILKTLVAKFDTLRFRLLDIELAQGPESTELRDIFDLKKGNLGDADHIPIPIASNSESQNALISSQADYMSNVRPLFQTLVRGLKTVMWCISHYQDPNESASLEFSRRSSGTKSTTTEFHPHRANMPYLLSQEEAETVSLFFYWGLLCCRVIVNRHGTQKCEFKEVLDNFAGAFTVIEHYNMLPTIGQHVPMLYDALLGSPALLAIVQTLLANSNVSATIADILVAFLTGKLCDLSNFEFPMDSQEGQQSTIPQCGKLHATAKNVTHTAAKVPPSLRASTLLRLFRIILGSVALFPQNAIILRGRLRTLACACLQHAASANRPIAYYFLLRSIFRSISSCISLNAFGFNSVQIESGPDALFMIRHLLRHRLQVKESTLVHTILTELCMTVPMSVKDTVSVLPYLFPLLLRAIHMTISDLPSLALRSLEYFLDHLGPAHFFLLLSDQPQLHVMMMVGVCNHLRPAPYALGTVALRILGKLGGRNRKFLQIVGDSFPNLAPLNISENHFLFSELLRTGFNAVGIFKEAPSKSVVSISLLLTWRGSPLQRLDPTPIDITTGRSKSKGTCSELVLDPYIKDVCELFDFLVRIGLEDKSGNTVINKSPLIGRFQTLCFRMLSSVLSALFELPAQLPFSKPPGSVLPLTRGNCDNQATRSEILPALECESANVLLCRLVYLVACAAAHSSLDQEGTPLLQSLSFVFALLLYSSWKNGHSEENISLKQLDDTKGSRRNRSIYKYVMRNHKLSPCAFVSTVLEAATDCCFTIANTALGALKYHMGCIYFLELQSLSISKPRSLLITDLISQIFLSLSDWDLPSCSKVCQILYQLLKIYGHVWARANKHILVASLLHALSHHDLNITLLSEYGIIQVLHAMLQTPCIGKNEHHSLVQLFTRKISSDNAAVRLASQSGIMELNRLAGFSLASSEFLRPIASNLAKVLISYHLKSVSNTRSAIGALDSLNYMMTLQPPPIKPDGELQFNLLACVQRSQFKKGIRHNVANIHGRPATQHCNFGWFSPSLRFMSALDSCILHHKSSLTLNYDDVLHAASLRAVHGLIRASKLITTTACSYQNNFSLFRETFYRHLPLSMLQKFLELALFTLTYDSENIATLVCTSLIQEILALREPSLAEICKAHFNSFLLQIPTKFNEIGIDFLDSLHRLISIPAMRSADSNEFVTYFLEFLKRFYHPERLLATRSWANDPPLELATKLMILVSHLNWHGPDQVLPVLSSAVLTVLKLEPTTLLYLQKYSERHIDEFDNTRYYSSWHTTQPTFPSGIARLEQSPFWAPLAQLLSSHAYSAASYFLNFSALADPHHVSILTCLVSMREATEFRLRILSSEGVHLLLNSAFAKPLVRMAKKSLACERAKEIYVKFDLQPDQGAISSALSRIHPQNRPNEANSSKIPPGHVHSIPEGASPLLVELAQLHGLQVVLTLHHLDKQLFTRHQIIGRIMIMLWRMRWLCGLPRRGADVPVGWLSKSNKYMSQHHRESFLMVQGLIGYCRSYPGDAEVLFDMLCVFMVPSPIDFTFLIKFYQGEVAVVWKAIHKRSILLFFLQSLSDQSIAMELKVMALRFLVTPMLVSTFECGELHLVTSSSYKSCVINSRISFLFMKCALDTANCQMHTYSEALRVELLKLTTILIEHLGRDLVEHRKDLIKFAWNHLKSDDSLSKQWAYVNVCRFVATYETPPKIILQVYVALLRTFQPEARELVKIALDILIPALPKRLPPADFVKAIKWTKKIMYEEGHALAQLVHTWQLVVRHPALFFPYRSQFMPQMVNSLNRLGLPPNCPVENRQLAVALADLIVNWEYKRSQLNLDDSKKSTICSNVHLSHDKRLTPTLTADIFGLNSRDSKTTSSGSTPSLTRPDGEFHLTMTMVEMVANFLVRLALFTSDNKESAVQHLAPRCLCLFQTTLQAWPNSHIRFSYFEKLIATTHARLDTTVANEPPYSPNLLYTTLDIVHITLGVDLQPNPFFIDNIAKVQLLICPCFYIQNDKIQSKLRKVIGRITELYPPGRSHISTMFFYQQVKYVIESRLILAMENHFTSSKPGDWAMCLRLTCKIFPIVKMIDSISMYAPAYVGNHGHQLLRLLQILVFHHLNSARSTAIPLQPICYATPTMSALTRAIGLVLDQSQDEPLQGHIYYDAGCDIIGTACTCLLLLSKGMMDHSLLHVRREFVVIVFVCLERSNSAELLVCLSKLICNWLTQTKSPLSKCEKVAFVEHILDIDDLTIIALQPLFVRFLYIINQFPGSLTYSDTMLSLPSNHRYVLRPLRYRNFSAIGLLALHPGVRAGFQSIFVQDLMHDLSHHIIELLYTDWSPLSNRFWIVILIEIILDGLDANSPLQLALASARMPSLAETGFSSHAIQACVDVSLQKQYGMARDCFALRTRSLRNLIEPLKELIHAHLGLAEKAWIAFLPLICSAIDQHQQGQRQTLMANAIFQQFMAPYHQPKLQVSILIPGSKSHADSKGSCVPPVVCSKRDRVAVTLTRNNLSITYHGGLIYGSTEAILSPLSIPQILIEACLLFPQILAADKESNKLVRNLLRSALKYNCHHAALDIIEQVIVLRQDSLIQSVSNDPRMLCAPLFSGLREADIRMHVLDDICTHPMSAAAFAMRRYGLIPHAQQTYFSNMISELDRQGPGTLLNRISDLEIDIWCYEWLGCARDMSQWVLLGDLPKCSPSPLPVKLYRPVLLLEARWKSHQWSSVREHLTEASNESTHSSVLVKYQSRKKGPCKGTPYVKLIQTRLAVAEGAHSEVEDLCGECIQLALESWGSLPKLHLGIATHDRLLHLFHELVEVHESSQLLHEALQHSRTFTYPDLRAVAHTWRNRLPNDWDSMSDWDDIMRWREHIYLSVQKAFCWGPADEVCRLHDAPWTIVTLARIARKQGLLKDGRDGICLRGLKEPSYFKLNVDDAFSRLRERILACHGTADAEFSGNCHNSSVHAHIQASLHLIKNTSTDLFHAEQRAELLRLKAIFLGSLGRCHDSHKAFSAATRACHFYGRAWYSWAVMCDVNSVTESSSSLLNQLLLNSFVCHLAAIECGYQRAVVCGLARILLLLRLSKQSGRLGNQLCSIPKDAWIPWLPQLMSMIDILGINNVMVFLVEAFPQAIYYSLRSEFLNYPDDSSRILLSQIMTSFHESNSILASKMDFVSDKMVLNAKPSPSEELLYLLNCIQKNKERSLQDRESSIFFRLIHKTSARHTGRCNLTSVGFETIWANRSGTLAAQAMGKPGKIRILSRHLHKLKTALLNNAVKVTSFPDQNNPHSTLSKLQFELKFAEMQHWGYRRASPFQVPGQFAHTFGMRRPELHLPLLHIEPSSCLRIRHGCFQRRFKFISDDGRGRIFSSSITCSPKIRTDERVSQFLNVVDYALTHSRVSQQRRLRVSVPLFATFGPNLKMVEDVWSWTSLSEMDHLRNANSSKGPIAPYSDTHMRALFFKARAFQRPPCARELDARRASYNKVCANKVSCNILINHIHATLDDVQSTWAFRRTYATQFAMPSVLGFVLAVSNDGAREIMVCRCTGRVYIDNFRPGFSSFHVRTALHRAGLSESAADSVPFRLTRNIERILQPFLLNSIMKSTMGALLLAMRATSESGGLLEPYVTLFLLDEMKKSKQQDPCTSVAGEKQLIMNRLITTAPRLHLSDGVCIEAGLNRLIQLAQSPDSIALMEAHWEPWL